MKEIKLTNSDLVALVDDEDFELVSKHRWYLNGNGYAMSGGVFLHRLILNLNDPSKETDHKDHNKLNDSKVNLRIVTHQQNTFNHPPREKGSSKYKGVLWHQVSNKWLAHITYNNHNFHLGLFSLEEDAAKAYNVKAIELFGEYAWLNPVDHIGFILSVRRRKTSKYRGVHQNKEGKWVATLSVNGKTIYLGRFVNEDEAARVYNDASILHLGKKARLNIINTT